MHYLTTAVLAILTILSISQATAGQRRDFVSEEEAELIREAQEIDLRIEMLTKFIDRRLAAAGIAGHQWSLPKKHSEKWGAEPTGTRTELLSDVRRLLQKMIDDIDDIASRTSTSTEGNEVGGKLFPKAVRTLASAATRYKPILEGELGKSQTHAERGLILQSIDFCDQIVEAAKQMPAETKKSKTR